MSGQVPIRDSVGAALAGVRENLSFVAIVSLIAASALTAIAALALAVPLLGIFTTIGATILRAFTYAAFIGIALSGAASVRGRVGADGWRVWAAMAVVAFFMFIIMFVLTIPGMIALIAGPMAAYVPELESAGQNNAAVIEIMTRFVREQPGAVLAFMLFYFAVWLLLTSRLYLAAPASADQGRILTFETWSWTKGSTLRITGARLLLLGPAWVLVGAIDMLTARLLGFSTFDPMSAAAVAQSSPPIFLVYAFITTLVTFLIYSSLEAGLSTYLYRGLKPAAATPIAA